MASEDLGKCEWWGRVPCKRPATVQTGWGDFRLCHGHEIVAAANKATHGEFGISGDEYRAELVRAKQWFRENPTDSSEESRDGQ